MKRCFIIHGTAIIGITVFAFLAMASSGTYTRVGNVATLTIVEGGFGFTAGTTGTLTISGNTMSGTFDGETMSATRLVSNTNPFVGAWRDEDGYIIIFDETNWLVLPGID